MTDTTICVEANRATIRTGTLATVFEFGGEIDAASSASTQIALLHSVIVELETEVKRLTRRQEQ